MNREEALKASRNGAIAALISALMTAIVVTIALTSDADGALSFWRDPINFIDVALILLCAYGMHKNSRAAALFIFVYFILSKVAIALGTGQITGAGLAIIFLYFYGKAIQGTFAFHKLEKAENPSYRAAPKWAIFVGTPVVAVFLFLMGFGLLTMTSILPSTEVQYRDEIARDDIEALRSAGVIYAADTVDYFYSFGFTSILQGGNVLTDNRVIVYFPDEQGEISVYEMYFEDIASVEKVEEGGMFSDTIYIVRGFDSEQWILLELSRERQGDERFIQAITDRIGRP